MSRPIRPFTAFRCPDKGPWWIALCAVLFAGLLGLQGCVWVDKAGWGSSYGEKAPHVRRLWSRQLPRKGRWRVSLRYVEKLPGPTPVGEFSIPAVSEGRLYVGTSSGDALAFDLETGERIWEKEAFLNAITCRPGVGGGFAVFAGQGAEAVAFDSLSGEEKWRVKLAGPVAGSIEVLEGAVYLQDVAGGLYSLDLATGTFLWRVRGRESPRLVARGFSGPVFDDMGARVFWGRWDGGLQAADRATGRLLWRQAYAAGRDERFSNIDIGLFFASESLWIAQFGLGVSRIRADDGIASWNSTDLSSAAGVAADVSRTYVPLSKGGMAALDSTLGSAIPDWGKEIDPDWGVLSQPILVSGLLAVSTTKSRTWSGTWWPPFFRFRPSGSVMLIDPETGNVVWRAKQLHGGFAGVYAGDGILASLSDRGVLQVWRIEPETDLTADEPEAPSESPPVDIPVVP